jgi:MerR HTH family regulatory protein
MSSTELCRRLHITLRELQWWCERGAVKCSFNGQHWRSFDEAQALAVGIVAVLRRKGMRLREVRNLGNLRLVKGDYLVTEGTRAMWCDEDLLLETVLACPAGCYVVCVKDLRAQLNPPQTRKAVA